MKVLIFDTETTGLPEGNHPSITETLNWPHIIQLSYIMYDTSSITIIDWGDDIIRIPPDVEISEKSIEIHGITRTMVRRKGISIQNALKKFNASLQKADYVVGHNISFDKRMIMVESIRLKQPQYFTVSSLRKPEYCTMKRNVDLCKIEKINRFGEKYFKYPSLSELYFHLFGEMPRGTHDSMADVLICVRCYGFIVQKHDVTKEGCKQFKSFYKTYCV